MEKTVGYLKHVAVVVDRRKLGGDKELGPLLSDSTVEGAGIGYIEDGIVDIEYLELVVTLVYMTENCPVVF